jgi:hypothetical protein
MLFRAPHAPTASFHTTRSTDRSSCPCSTHDICHSGWYRFFFNLLLFCVKLTLRDAASPVQCARASGIPSTSISVTLGRRRPAQSLSLHSTGWHMSYGKRIEEAGFVSRGRFSGRSFHCCQVRRRASHLCRRLGKRAFVLGNRSLSGVKQTLLA